MVLDYQRYRLALAGFPVGSVGSVRRDGGRHLLGPRRECLGELVQAFRTDGEAGRGPVAAEALERL